MASLPPPPTIPAPPSISEITSYADAYYFARYGPEPYPDRYVVDVLSTGWRVRCFDCFSGRVGVWVSPACLVDFKEPEDFEGWELGIGLALDYNGGGPPALVISSTRENSLEHFIATLRGWLN